MNNALSTLFLGLRDSALDGLAPTDQVLFLNATYSEHISCLSKAKTLYQQDFKPFAKALEAHDLRPVKEIPKEEERFHVVLIMLPKSQIESGYLIARGLKALKKGGYLLCAADNKAGGARMAKTLQTFGLRDLSVFSKNKARVCVAKKEEIDFHVCEQAQRNGSEQEILNGAFISQPGMFGWNKEDQGSKLLIEHLPKALSGRGADLGCGYGYLSAHALKKCPNIEHLTLIDADYRAVTCARKNLNDRAEVLWDDVRAPETPLQGLDFILMNPPFHENKASDQAIGQDFIKTAANSLRSGGVLWMVANNQLAYEDHLNALFSDVKKPFEGKGFKIFHAVK